MRCINTIPLERLTAHSDSRMDRVTIAHIAMVEIEEARTASNLFHQGVFTPTCRILTRMAALNVAPDCTSLDSIANI